MLVVVLKFQETGRIVRRVWWECLLFSKSRLHKILLKTDEDGVCSDAVFVEDAKHDKRELFGFEK